MAWVIRHAYRRDCKTPLADLLRTARGGSTRLVPSHRQDQREPWLPAESLGQQGECVLSPPGCCVSPRLAKVLYTHPPLGHRSRPLALVSGGGGWCVSEEALLLSHAHLKKEKKKLMLLLHLLLCPSPCCVPRTPPRRQPFTAAPGLPRVLATARSASAWPPVLYGMRR